MNIFVDGELLMRLFAEAVHQLGGVLRVCVADLDEHRGRVEVSIDGDVLTATSTTADADILTELERVRR